MKRALPLLLCLLPSLAIAQEVTPPVASTATRSVASGDAFSSLDADKDGRVSSIEADADAGFSASFASMDGNADGFVTQDEYRAHAAKNAKPIDAP